MRALVLLPIALVLVACGKSQEDIVKEQLAKRTKPGRVRLINLSSNPVNFRVKIPVGYTDVAAQQACKFYLIKSGSNEVEVTGSNGQPNSIQMQVTPEAATSIIVTDADQKGELVEGEVYHTSNTSIRVIGDSAVSGFTAELKGPNSESFSDKIKDSKAHEGSAGKYTVQIKDESGKTVATADVQAEMDKAYTLAVGKSKDGKVVVVQVLNNPDQRPTASGVSNA